MLEGLTEPVRRSLARGLRRAAALVARTLYHGPPQRR